MSFSAFAEDKIQSMDVDGSSGKYLPAREAACSAAQADARHTATSACERDQGKVDGPLIFGACACEQGGFEEKEWLCSTTTTLTCRISDQAAPTTPSSMPSTELPADGLSLELPTELSNLELLDRVFHRRGFALPKDVLGSRLDAKCSGGWQLACKAPKWMEGDNHSLAKAAKDLDLACSSADDEACIAYGWSLEDKAIASGDGAQFRAAARKYKSLCDGKKQATACYDYGTILFNSMGVTADPRLGIKRWNSACELGSAAACSALAKIYRTGLKTKVDLSKAASYAGTACNAGDPAGCVEQALLQNDKVREQDQLARACSLGSVQTCWSLSSAYLNGERAEPAVGRTRALLDLGCALGDGRSCNSSGELAMNDGDDESAATQFRTACKSNVVAACNNLVDLVLTDRIDSDVYGEPYAFEVACSKGNVANACSELGLALLDSNQGGISDKPRARALLRQSCKNETSPAKPCFVLGDLYETGKGGERDRTLAAQYYKWACAQGWGQACERRGDLLRDGVGVRLNHADSVVMYQAGCDAGLATACHSGGILLDDGTYIPRDPQRAFELYDTACTRGVPEACLRLGNLALDPEIGRDEAKARDAYETAVGLNNIEAHRRLAYMLWNGVGGKKDKGRAKSLTTEGCKNDDPIACRGPAFQTEK